MAKRDNDLEFSVNAAFDDERAVDDKLPLYLMNGSLGAGKTSVLEFLLQQSGFKGARVIENEYANENIDGYRLEGLADIVTTLAGDCVCCSSAHALTRMLYDFSRSSPAPVFIEATGVARTMNLVERLVNAGVFKRYELAHSFYVVEAREILGEISAAQKLEMQAADTVLVTKEDLLAGSELAEYREKLAALPYARVISAPHGEFDADNMPVPSGLLSFFDEYDGELAMPDNPTYSVIDASQLAADGSAYEALWPELVRAYGLRRLKGAFVDSQGVRRHIEATPTHWQIGACRAGQPLKIVLIGERAEEITRDVLESQLMLFGG